jgi:hypothetical protein
MASKPDFAILERRNPEGKNDYIRVYEPSKDDQTTDRILTSNI